MRSESLQQPGASGARHLVTGATGFIGARLVERLLLRGERVRVLVRRAQAAERWRSAGVEVVVGALEDEASLARAVEGVELVYHCAGLSTDWAKWQDFEQVNVTGAEALALAAARAQVRRFVHISTTDVYGYPEHAGSDASAPRDVGLPYNRSKLRGEECVLRVGKETGLSVTVLRPATVYGPGSKDWGLEIAHLLRSRQMLFIDGGRAHAGLIYVDNLIDALLTAAELPAAAGRVYTLRDEHAETWRSYITALARGLELPVPWLSLPLWLALVLGWLSEQVWRLLRRPSRPLLTRHAVYVVGRDQGFGIERAKRDLAFSSSIPFVEGLERMLTWLKSAEGRALLARK